jgi:hypothetical protein
MNIPVYPTLATRPANSKLLKAAFQTAGPQLGHSFLYRCDDDHYVGVLISLWLFLFAAQPKESFLDGLKKLEQRSVELKGNM